MLDPAGGPDIYCPNEVAVAKAEKLDAIEKIAPKFQTPLFIKVMLYHYCSANGRYDLDANNETGLVVDQIYSKAIEYGLLEKVLISPIPDAHIYSLTNAGSDYLLRLLTTPVKV